MRDITEYVALMPIKAPSGKITSYNLQSTNDCGICNKTVEEIKQMLHDGIGIANLKLTSNGRLMNTNFRGDLRGKVPAVCAYTSFSIRNFFGSGVHFTCSTEYCSAVDSFRLYSIESYDYKRNSRRKLKIEVIGYLAAKGSKIIGLVIKPNGEVVSKIEKELSKDGIIDTARYLYDTVHRV